MVTVRSVDGRRSGAFGVTDATANRVRTWPLPRQLGAVANVQLLESPRPVRDRCEPWSTAAANAGLGCLTSGPHTAMFGRLGGRDCHGCRLHSSLAVGVQFGTPVYEQALGLRSGRKR